MAKITNDMYSKLPNLVLGFHGCSSSTYDSVILSGEDLKPSDNNYDWLGNGIYFWENSYERAYDWAKSKYGEDARVIGAILDLGYCLNLTDYSSTEVLEFGYSLLVSLSKKTGVDLPQNHNGRSETDVLLRNLDCAVIEQLHDHYRSKGYETYDSIRGVFTEGESVYPGSGFVKKTHTQICIVNPNCIKGYFAPRERKEEYSIP